MRAAALMLISAIAAPAVAQSAKPASAQSGGDKDKVVCRREVPIGSLIASRKTCLTKEQWQKRAEDGNAVARNLVEDSAGACGQNGGVCPF